jgi:tripartite ATP-independent transporter DctM subunit
MAVISMLVLFICGIPVFATFLVINIVSVSLLMGVSGFGLFTNSMYQSLTSASLTAAPLFILMGEILFRSGISETLIDSIDYLIGKVRGRDFLLITMLSAIFAALCGSAVAVAALMGRTILPTMLQRGYGARLTAGAVVGGATLAAIIPPSVIIVIMASMVGVSTGGMLIAGIVPGLFIAFLMLVYTYIRIIFNPSLEPERIESTPTDHPIRDRILAVFQLLPFCLVIFSVIGLIMLGIATPSESAATGVIGALIASAVYRKLSFRMFYESLVSTVRISATILIILVASKLFGQLLSFTGASAGLLQAITSFDLSYGLMFLVLMAIPFVLCMFIDPFAVLAVAVPIYIPIVSSYGFDPMWFWMLFLINLCLGSMTPPFGYTLFALKASVGNISLQDVYFGAYPMVFVFVIGIIVM